MTDKEPYNKREIDTLHSNILERMGQHNEATIKELKEIKVQTTLHNGRMKSLERWQAYMTGGMTVLTLIVVPILAWALWVLVNIQGQVHSAVDDALSAYNVE